ncbi:hypothetical protein STEG23_014928 [Scotinomys teguina]
MKYSPIMEALPQPPGSRNQESRHIRLSVLKPQGCDSHRKHQWGRYFQAKLEEPPTTLLIEIYQFNSSKTTFVDKTSIGHGATRSQSKLEANIGDYECDKCSSKYTGDDARKAELPSVEKWMNSSIPLKSIMMSKVVIKLITCDQFASQILISLPPVDQRFLIVGQVDLDSYTRRQQRGGPKKDMLTLG